jgi:hypothetical protein
MMHAESKFPGANIHQILCKCDPLTAENLINASLYVRCLYMRYSETALPSITAQYPAPVNALLRLSMDLHTMRDDQFDPVSVLELLDNVSLLEWPVPPNSNLSPVDPLESLHSVSDYYTEIQEAADLMGKLMVIRVERFVNPHVCVSPITFSTTERVRFVSTLLVLKIYYQLRLKFLEQLEYAGQFASLFESNLAPWQADQGATLARMLFRIFHAYEQSLCHWDQTESNLLRSLMDSRYVKSHHALTHHVPVSSFRILPPFPHNLNAHRGGRGRGYGHHVRHPAISAQLCNHVSSCSDPTLHDVTPAHTSRYANICRQLGLYFWDYSRLSAWDLADPVALIAAVDAHPGLSPVALRYNDTPWWEIGTLQRDAARERTTQRQIIEWTRCPVQCGLEEWLWQKTALQRLQKGEEAPLIDDIVVGALCDECGLDGHMQYKCRQAVPDQTAGQ